MSRRGKRQGHHDVTWRGIVKVQRNLAGTHDAPGSMVRVNSEDGSVFYVGPIEKKIAAWFPQYEHKFFAHAELVGTIINFTRKADWQDW